MKKKITVIVSSLLLLSLLFYPASAKSASTDKGQTSVEGGITFYDETLETKETTPSTDEVNTEKKIYPMLPKTGESNVNNFVVIVILLFIFMLIIFLHTKKLEEE